MAEQIRELNPRAAVDVVLHPRYDLPYTRQLPDRELARSRLGLDSEGAVFLFFGLVREYKGLDILLAALSMLPPGGSWTCLVAGEFYKSKETYEARIRELGLENMVRLEDRYIPNSEVPLYFAAADLTVLPYRNATQSGVAALSFALNRPVLTTRVGALPEMITEGENGWLVPPDDPVALASVLSEVVGDRLMAALPVVKGRSGLPDWGELARVVVRLAARVAQDVREAHGHWMEFTEHADGAITARFGVVDLGWVSGWVLSYGAAARVLEPPELIDRVRAAAEGALGRYRDAP